LEPLAAKFIHEKTVELAPRLRRAVGLMSPWPKRGGRCAVTAAGNVLN
jgi:hypothetical protein